MGDLHTKGPPAQELGGSYRELCLALPSEASAFFQHGPREPGPNHRKVPGLHFSVNKMEVTEIMPPSTQPSSFLTKVTPGQRRSAASVVRWWIQSRVSWESLRLAYTNPPAMMEAAPRASRVPRSESPRDALSSGTAAEQDRN
ncbi:Zinc Finger Matrin-Type Protein 2 [Manis pentadactyla]|nr:Zinc Finger Matrin-Type Protein 2 [Manis pentadactyla]